MSTKALSKKKTSSKSSKKHIFSKLLSVDPRVVAAPRHLEVVHRDEQCVVMVKVYAGLDTPGSELMTVSVVDASSGLEREIRFDEKFPIWMRFKKEDDVARAGQAKQMIEKLGGFQKLALVFDEIKFSV